MKLSKNQLRNLIESMIDEANPTPMMDHPLASDDDDLSVDAVDLLEQLAQQVASDMSETSGDPSDADLLIPELSNALRECLADFFSGFEM